MFASLIGYLNAVECTVKSFLGCVLILIVSFSSAFSKSDTLDVVYLKDGTIIHGVIEKQQPEHSVIIKTVDGKLLEIQMDQILKIEREVQAEFLKTAIPARKSPALAGALSLVFPGAGQFYNGDVGKGLAQDALVGVGLALILAESHKDSFGEQNETFKSIGIAMVGGAWIWSIIDAPISANKKNKKLQIQSGHLLEFESGKSLIGVDAGYIRNSLGGKITYHF